MKFLVTATEFEYVCPLFMIVSPVLVMGAGWRQPRRSRGYGSVRAARVARAALTVVTAVAAATRAR
jgi:hypothetical protein